jgi:polyphosphate kinase
VLERIEREAAHARAGRAGRIVAKMNAINEPQVIRALYRLAGRRQIDLIVRGACTLRPGLPGVSDNIRVRSVVGRFLEHSRSVLVRQRRQPELFCASADWLERNLLRRVEDLLPDPGPGTGRTGARRRWTTTWPTTAMPGSCRPTAATCAAPRATRMPHSAQAALLEKLCT